MTAIARRHLVRCRQLLQTGAREAGIANPDRLASQLLLLIEGASVALAQPFLPRAKRLAGRTAAPWPDSYERASVDYFEHSLGVDL